MHKKCRICKESKDISYFHKKKDSKDGHRNECKDCMKIIQKKYKEHPKFKEKQKEYDKKRYKEKREEILLKKKEYHMKNKEKILNDKKIYRDNNKELIKKWRKNNKKKLSELQKIYRKKYPHIIAWRSLLHRILYKFGTKKSDKTINCLGYSSDDLKFHIEMQFEKDMNWNNYGKWEIDHKKPVSSFDKTDSIMIVNSLDNLQPLWKKDNLIKGSKK